MLQDSKWDQFQEINTELDSSFLIYCIKKQKTANTLKIHILCYTVRGRLNVLFFKVENAISQNTDWECVHVVVLSTNSFLNGYSLSNRNKPHHSNSY